MVETQSREADTPLSSWKEIARFLNVDVRTCQRWERQFGLPVHRIQNAERSRVEAYPEEIAAWRKTAFRTKNGDSNGGPHGNGKANGPTGSGLKNGLAQRPREAIRRAFKPVYLASLAIPVLLSGAAFVLFPPDRNPADFRIDGPSMVILNKGGRELWRFDTKLPNHGEEISYRFAFPDKTYRKLEVGEIAEFPFIVFRDLDADGRSEVLFVPKAGNEMTGELILFDSRGKIRWRFETGAEVRVGERTYPPDSVINMLDVRDMNSDGRPEILVVAHCFEAAPTRVVLLDPGMRILGEYWNYGQLSDCAFSDVDGNGSLEIILVGTNNEYGQACLVVLDAADMKGTSPEGPLRQFAGFPDGSEKLYVRLAVSEADLLIHQRGVLRHVQVMKDGHVLADTDPSRTRFDFDPGWNAPLVVLTDEFRKLHKEFADAGRLSRPLDEAALQKELAAGVLYYDGASKTWVNRRAMSNPWPGLPNR